MENILIKPLVTEKATSSNEKGVFGFVVNRKANKVQIKRAVESTYGVKVDNVNTAIIPGKKKSRYSKSNVISGSSSTYKKAFVRLAEGEVIDFYSNI